MSTYNFGTNFLNTAGIQTCTREPAATRCDLLAVPCGGGAAGAHRGGPGSFFKSQSQLKELFEKWSNSNLHMRNSGFAGRHAGEGVILVVGGGRTGATEKARMASAA
jgi:hypothetical protein